MKQSICFIGLLCALGFGSFHVLAQTVQYVTITSTNSRGTGLPVQPNQIVSLVGYDWVYKPALSGDSTNGTVIVMNVPSSVSSQLPQIFTGMTNITLVPTWNGIQWGGAATFQITTPTSAAVVTNYVPADAIVMPASATGNVQIILESSPDLVNWTAAEPGSYGPSSATNRFFRVRAVAN